MCYVLYALYLRIHWTDFVLLSHMERSYSGGVQRGVIFEFWLKMDNWDTLDDYRKINGFCTRYYSVTVWDIPFCCFTWKDSILDVCNEELFFILSQKWTILDTLNIGDFQYVMSSLYVTLYVLCFVRALSRNPLNGFCSAIAYGKIIYRLWRCATKGYFRVLAKNGQIETLWT